MEEKVYPGFAARHNRQFIILLIVCAVLMGAGMLAFCLHQNLLGGGLSVLWCILLLSGLIYLMYRIKRPLCPTCGKKLSSHADTKTDRWLSTCSSCEVVWDLGVGCHSN